MSANDRDILAVLRALTEDRIDVARAAATLAAVMIRAEARGRRQGTVDGMRRVASILGRRGWVGAERAALEAAELTEKQESMPDGVLEALLSASVAMGER